MVNGSFSNVHAPASTTEIQMLDPERRPTSQQQFSGGPDASPKTQAPRVEPPRPTRTRREVLLSAGLALTAGALVSAPEAGSGATKSAATRSRSLRNADHNHEYFFDFSGPDAFNFDFYMVGAGHTIKLDVLSESKRLSALQQYPHLTTVAPENLTHTGDFLFSADTHSLHTVKRVPPGEPIDGADAVPVAIFYHFPDENVIAADQLMRAAQRRYQLPDDPVGAQRLVSSSDTASALVSMHPELLALDGQAAAIVQAMIQQQAGFSDLASFIQRNRQTYLILERLNDQDGQPIRVSNGAGSDVQATAYSIPQPTAELLAPVIAGVLTEVKNEELLGGDITGIDPSDSAENANLTGSLWLTRDGVSGTETGELEETLGQSGKNFSAVDLTSAFPGLTITVISTTNKPDHTIVRAKIVNHYNRYLGLYARFFDAQGNPIVLPPAGPKPSSISDIMGYPNADGCFGLGLSPPTFMVFGQPAFATTVDIDISVPLQAQKVDILAGGLGSGNPGLDIPDSVTEWGTIMTGCVCMAAPPLFLVAGAAATYAGWLEAFKPYAPLLFGAYLSLGEVWTGLTTQDAAQMENFALNAAKILVLNPTVWATVLAAIGLGEVEDLIPFVGPVIAAAAAINIGVNLDVIDSELRESPSAYVTEVVLTHDVYASWDPGVTPGVGAYVVNLTTSGGAHVHQVLPAGTSQAVFPGIPRGGKMLITLAAFQGRTFDEARTDKAQLIGSASASLPNLTAGQNVKLKIEPTIRTLDRSTEYDVQAVTIAGQTAANPTPELAWQPVATGWVAQNDPNITALHGLTINRATYDIGRSWRAKKSTVPECGTSGGNLGADLALFGNSSAKWNSDRSNLDFTASVRNFRTGENGRVENLVFNDDPCGFAADTLVAYDEFSGDSSRNYYLDPSSDNAVRQIRFVDGERPDFDAPDSGLSVGRFNFESEALHLHPSGVLISVSKNEHRMEVLTPLAAPVGDSAAPRATVVSGRGKRRGRLDGPNRIAVTVNGTVLVAEQENARVSALDTAGNPVPTFDPRGPGPHSFLLDPADGTFTPTTEILDLAVEHGGHIYVLLTDPSPQNPSKITGRYINIYEPDGRFLVRIVDTYSKRIVVDHWRVMYGMDGTSVDRTGSLPWSGPAYGDVTEPAVTLAVPVSKAGDPVPEPEPPAPEPEPPELPETT